MEYIDFSVKDLKVSRIGLGTWAMGGWSWGGTDEGKAIATLQSAIDSGITLVDTAPVYGFGASEEIVGKALSSENRREKAIIATKVGLNWDADENVFRDSSADRVHKEFEDSLRRLKTDYIDIYQVHWPDFNVPFKVTAEILLGFLETGKIRAIGVSNFSVEQMKMWMQYAPIHSIQPPYNLFEREAEEEVIPFAQKNKISILSYGSLCRGLLSGAYSVDTKFSEGDMRKDSDPKFQKENFKNYLKAVDELNNLAEEKGKTVSQLAARWVLDQGITTALWGARRIDQLDPIKGVAGWNLTKEDIKRIDEIVKKNVPVPISPVFMAPPK